MWIGAFVLLTDFAKGSVAVLLARALFHGQEGAVLTSAACSVLGHVVSPWIGFKGGRGLATGAGALAFIAWPTIAFWGLFWLLGYFLFRSVNPANALATIVTFAAVLFLPALLTYPGATFGYSIASTGFVIAAIMVLIMAKLVGPVKEYLAERRRVQ
jgi:glycerol-3-phosphate acyltransferase PlsY